MPLNPQWDEQFLDLLAEQRIAEVDTWDNDAMVFSRRQRLARDPDVGRCLRGAGHERPVPK